MASACVNNSPAIPPPFSFFTLDDGPKPDPNPNPPSDPVPDPVPECERSAKEPTDFEFRLHDPVDILTADELFANGKLVPLQLTPSRPQLEVRSPDPIRSTIRSEIALSDPSISSPKAPKCSSRWRDLLGLKRAQNPNPNTNPRSIKNLLNRNPRSSAPSLDPTLSLPLLRDSDSDSFSLSSSRLSLSSTSSSSDSSDPPRFSLDFDKANLSRTGGPIRVQARPVRRSAIDAESPRMNSSGKVVFYSGSLERSSSSPGSFNGGGSRVRAREMNRSFSAHVVRVNPVLNVPVCTSGSVFGFFSGPKSAKSNVKMRKERPSRE